MPEPIQIIIVEDDDVIAFDLKISLQKLGYEVLALFKTGEELLPALNKYQPNLVILDIQLAGKLDGINVGDLLQNHYQLPFIYLSSQIDEQTLSRAKLTQPYAYLLKPLNVKELQATIEIALHKFRSQNLLTNLKEIPQSEEIPDHIFVKTKNRLEKVRLQEILWLEAKDIYCIINTEKQQYVVSQSLKTLEQELPGSLFLRTHRSYMVAFHKIDAIEDNNILLANQRIPIGKTYKEDLLKRLRII